MNDVEIDDGEKENENREEIRIRKAKDIETMFYYTYPNKRMHLSRIKHIHFNIRQIFYLCTSKAT